MSVGGYCGLNEGLGGAPCPKEGLRRSVIILDTAGVAECFHRQLTQLRSQ